MKEKFNLFIQALKEGVVPATGCTEPVAVAYAAATATDYLVGKDDIKDITVKVSPNVMKNALAVIVPGTGEPGLAIAAAAGLVSGDSSQGLSVIANLKKEDVKEIKQLAFSGKIDIQMAPVEDDLYVELTIRNSTDSVTVWIAAEHTNIFKIKKNDVLIKSEERPQPHAVSKIKTLMQQCTFKEIWDFALNESLKSIEFMSEAGKLNMALAKEGLNNQYGIGLGLSISRASDVNFGSGIEADLATKILAYAAAASDARMGGAQLPAMSNSGSGNQGITATVPVCVVAEFLQASEERLIRALTLAHLTAIYTHSFLPVLSAFCATDSAAFGAAAAICYLKDNSFNEAEFAINNMAADAPGMICDGAGCSCAMKVATSVSSMYRSVNLALQGVTIPASNGIVCENVDDTIRGVGKLGTIGLEKTDKTILSVMLDDSLNFRIPK